MSKETISPTRQEAEAAAVVFVKATNNIAAIESDIRIAEAELHAKYGAQLDEQKETLAEAQAVLASFTDQNKDELLTGGARSTKLGAVTVGYRKSAEKITYLKGFDVVAVIKMLRNAGSGWRKTLKTSETVDKKALLTEALKHEPKKLRQLGIQITQDETFYIK